MAASERLVGVFPQPMCSSTILTIRSLHEIGQPKKASHAAAVGKHDALRKPSAQPEGKSVSSTLKPVQESGVIQQFSSIKHLLFPELPYALINEIKKRMAFKEQDDELDDGFMGENSKDSDPLIAKGLILGPRCAWPRSKAKLSEEKQQEQGPRCAWPRAMASNPSSFQLAEGGAEDGAKCAWPRARNTTSVKVGECVDARSSPLAIKSLLEENEEKVVIVEGPRCAWPRGALAKNAPSKDLPRRMLATSVGLSLMNYLLVAQGAPALANPSDLLLQDPMGEELLQSPTNKRSLVVLR